MKTTISILKYSVLNLLILFTFACSPEDGEEGPQGPQGENGVANLIDSGWFNSGTWSGSSESYYFDKVTPELTEDLVNNGVVLAYAKLDNDNNVVRPLPATTGNNSVVFWNFFITESENIRFTTTLNPTPSTVNQYRYIIIPPSSSVSSRMVNINFKEMSYSEVISYFNLDY